MIDHTQLEQSKAIQRRTGRTFHVATRLLPRRIRESTYVLYAFFRIADDVVDDPDPPEASRQRAELDRIRDAALGERPTDDPVLTAFQQIREEYSISASEVTEFIEAMERDISADRYETHDQLAGYLRGSSVAVANMMLALMEPADQEAARPHARALAEAFQLTNFLRDVREDVREYDRIYLPREQLERHGVSEDEIERLEFTDEFAALMEEELASTERLYREGVAGIATLPCECQFAVVLAAVLYADHHRLIRAQEFDVLSNRPSLSTRRRLSLVVRTWWYWKRTGDAQATFDAASTLPTDGASGDHAVAGERPGADERHDARESITGDRRRRLRPVTGLLQSVRALFSPGNSE